MAVVLVSFEAGPCSRQAWRSGWIQGAGELDGSGFGQWRCSATYESHDQQEPRDARANIQGS